MSRYTIFSVLAFALLFTACVDEIKLDIEGAAPKIAVDGLIADSLDTYTISVKYSSIIGVGNDNILEPVSGASVKVVDDTGNEFEFLEGDAGIYAREMQGTVGQTYHVEIDLPDGTQIESAPQLLQAAPEIGEIEAVVRDETRLSAAGNAILDRRLLLKMNTSLKDLETRPFLRWRAEGEYELQEWFPMALSLKTCYIRNNVDLNNLRVFDTRTLAGTEIENEVFIDTPLNYRFAIQYCFHVKQYSMSEAEYEYWNTVGNITNIDGSLFDPPPGTVRGNLINKNNPEEIVVGYFSVSGVQSKRYFANPQTLNLTDIEPKCRWRFGQTPTQDCVDCTLIQNSTLAKPSYWLP